MKVCRTSRTLKRWKRFLLVMWLGWWSAGTLAQGFEEAVVNIGNVGLTITNAGFVGKANVRNNPAGPPSFEYPLDSGVEHLFEAGLWIGAIRSDGLITVRTGAITSSGGYRPGAAGYELAPLEPIIERSTLPTSPVFTRAAVSHQDFLTAYTDTARFLPGTLIPMPDPAGQLGAKIIQTSYAWNFPFTESFVIINFDIINISDQPWDSVYVGLYHDLVVRNVNTTQDQGSAFFNKNGVGFIDSLHATYAFNAGGTEESINTYGAIAFLGAEWRDPRTGQRRFFHPNVADEYIRDGYTPPIVNPRWWLFSGGTDERSRPGDDRTRYQRMGTPYPNPADYPGCRGVQDLACQDSSYVQAVRAWREELRTAGQRSQGNWIGLTPVGPFRRVLPGDTLRVTFAFVGALKPEAYQGLTGRPIDNAESRSLLRTNLFWARRTYAGEDLNYNGRLDPGEDVNGNGRLDRYLIPEPPPPPRVRVEFTTDTDPQTGRTRTGVVLYWDRSAEAAIDPVTGRRDFEGYRIYRTNPGDDRFGNLLDRAVLIAQYDRPGNRTGFNNGFEEIRLSEPVTFPDDTTQYWYRFEMPDLKAGWQYLFIVTAFDEGDPDTGLEPLESSRTAGAVRVFPGTTPTHRGPVGVYPNPYRAGAAWDGGTSRTRKLYFYNLPPRCEIRIYTLAGEIVKTLYHDAATYTGDIRWFNDFSGPGRRLSGGEHAWDLLSENGLDLASGLYLFTVKDLDTGEVQRGKFVIIK